MKLLLSRIFLTLISLLVLQISCSEEEKKEPSKEKEIIQVEPLQREVSPFQVFVLPIDQLAIDRNSYRAFFKDTEIEVYKSTDTTLVGLVPDTDPGQYTLTVDLNEGTQLFCNFEVKKKAASIADPGKYVNDFVGNVDSVYASLKVELENLPGTFDGTSQKALSDLETYKNQIKEQLLQFNSAPDEEKRKTAQFLAANRSIIDSLTMSFASFNGRVKTDIGERVRNFTYYIYQAGTWTTLAVGLSALNPAVGVVIGGGILGLKVIPYLIKAKNEGISLASEIYVDIQEKSTADFPRIKTVHEFQNGKAKKLDLKIYRRSLQPSDLSSQVSWIRDFVDAYYKLYEIYNRFVMGSDQPQFPALVEKVIRPTESKHITIEVLDEDISARLVEEEGGLKIEFTSEKIKDSKEFTFHILYNEGEGSEVQVVIDAKLIPLLITAKIVGGNNQIGFTGKALTDSLEVQVLDSENKPVKNSLLIWQVTKGGGKVEGSAKTDTTGLGSAKWILGLENGEQEVLVKVLNEAEKEVGSLTFKATTKVSYELKYVLGNNQQAPFSSKLKQDLIVRVVDHLQLPVKDQYVTWTVLEGGGSLNATYNTDDNGEATAQWTLGKSGIQKVSARYTDASGTTDLPGSPIIFSASISNADLAVISGDNQVTGSRQNLAPVVLSFKDDNDNPIVNKLVVMQRTDSVEATTSDSFTDAQGRVTYNLTTRDYLGQLPATFYVYEMPDIRTTINLTNTDYCNAVFDGLSWQATKGFSQKYSDRDEIVIQFTDNDDNYHVYTYLKTSEIVLGESTSYINVCAFDAPTGGCNLKYIQGKVSITKIEPTYIEATFSTTPTTNRYPNGFTSSGTFVIHRNGW